MSRKNREIELRQDIQNSDMPITINFGATLQDKLQVLDDYYLWLYNQNYDANSAAVLSKYKDLLKKQEINNKGKI